MLKEFVEKIEQMAGPKIFEVNGHTFFADGATYGEVKPDVEVPEELPLTSLDAMVKMVRSEGLSSPYRAESPIYITVPDPLTVRAFCTVMPSACQCHRPMLYKATAADVPGWAPEVKMPFEQAAVALQTRFQEGGDRDYTIQLLSMITTGVKVTYNDIGVATNVVTSKGVVLQENSQIKPLVKLRPYRTFQEVEQPEGLFLIRIDERGISFIEADGGMWKLTARQTVAEWLADRLEDEVKNGDVVIAL